MRLPMKPFKQALHLILIFGMIFNYCPIVQAEDSQDQKEIPISGEWEVTYSDRYLGAVRGEALVSEDEQSATVTLYHPESQESVELKSTSIKRNEDEVIIELEGESPQWLRQDGLNYPHEPVIIHETSRTLKAEYGENKKSISIAPRKPSDLNKVTLELSLFGNDHLSGRWYYYSDAVTFSDTKGYGRHGDIIEEDDGRIIAQGYEGWKRPKLKIFGIITLEDQLDIDRGIRAFAYPFGSKPINVGKHRYLFIFGENLPTKFTDPVNITQDEDDHIKYGNALKMEATEGNVYARDQYERGFKKLLESLPEAEHAHAKKFDALIVRADLQPGVVPGYHTFELNGVEKGWSLQFGNNRARSGFSREIRQPTGEPTYEWTQDLFLPEVVYLEVHTEVELPVDEIPLMVGIDGQTVNLNGSDRIIAKRVKGDEEMIAELAQLKKAYKSETDKDKEEGLRWRIKSLEAYIGQAKRAFRTQALTLKKGTPNKKKSSNYTLLVQVHSKVTASIAAPGLISVDPPVATATVWQYPGEKQVNSRWREYLQKAYACDDDRVGLDWSRVNYEKSDEINHYVVLAWEKLSTRIDMGDHAAMILLRQTFLDLIDEKDKEFEKIKDEITVAAFRRYIEPYVWNDNYPIGNFMVEGKDGKEAFFASTFLDDGIRTSHKKQDDAHKKWVKKVTLDAIAQYRKELNKAYTFAKETDICDVEDLLELTGVGFDEVLILASSRLMRLNDDPSKPVGWIPHYPARGFLKRLNIHWETVKLQERTADDDSNTLLLVAAIVSMPVIMYGGTVGMVAGLVIDVVDIAATSYMEISKAYEKDVEVAFALAASEVLGEQRKKLADARDITWTKAVGSILLSSVGILFAADDIGKLYKIYKTPLHVRRIIRGRRLVDALTSGKFKKLRTGQKRDLHAFVVNARKKLLTHGILDEAEEAALKAMDELGAPGKPLKGGAPPAKAPKKPDPGDSLFGKRYEEILGPDAPYPGKNLLYMRLMTEDVTKAAPKRLMNELEAIGVPPEEIARIAEGGPIKLAEAILEKVGLKEITSKEARDLMQLSVRATKGTATAKDVAKLRNMVDDAGRAGEDFWDDLAHKGTLGEDGFQHAVPDKGMRDAMEKLARDGAPPAPKPKADPGGDTLPPPAPGSGGRPAPFDGAETLPPPGGRTRPPPTGDAAGAADELAETVRFGEDGRPLADGAAGDAHRTLDDLADHDMGRGLDEHGRPLADGAAGRAHDSLDTIAKHEMGRGLDEFGRPLADGAAGRAHDSLETIAKHEMGSGVAKPAWMSKVDGATAKQLEDLLHRPDIHSLMDDAAEFVQKSLKGADADKVMDLIRNAPHQTGKQLEDSINAMRKRVDEPQGKAFYKQADDADLDLLDELEAHGWSFEGTRGRDSDSFSITFTDPKGNTGSAFRSFDEATGTFEMNAAFREKAAPWIKEGFDKPLVPGKGMPTIMFVNMRFMNAFGIGYAGQAGKMLKAVKMEHVINPRSAIQLEWMRRVNFPDKTFTQAVTDGSINDLARHCFSVKYAEDAITMAGYRIKGVRIELDPMFSPGGAIGGAKKLYKGKEPWEELLKRYGLDDNSEVNTFYNIIIDVEPF